MPPQPVERPLQARDVIEHSCPGGARSDYLHGQILA